MNWQFVSKGNTIYVAEESPAKKLLLPDDKFSDGRLVAAAVLATADYNLEITWPGTHGYIDKFLRQWPQGPQLRFTLAEAARILGVARQTLLARIKAGPLEAYHDGKRYLLSWPAIRDYRPMRPGPKPKKGR